MITAITNVKNTINNRISFKQGVQQNQGALVVNHTSANDNFVLAFMSSFQDSPLNIFNQRRDSIEAKLQQGKQRLNTIV